MSDFGEALIEGLKEALIIVHKERIEHLQREVERLRKLTLRLSMDRHVPAMRISTEMRKQQAQATDDYMLLLTEVDKLKSELAAEKTLADRLYVEMASRVNLDSEWGGPIGELVAAYHKAREIK